MVEDLSINPIPLLKRDLQKGLDDTGVKMCAAAVSNNVLRILMVYLFMIETIRRQGVKDIRNGKYARGQRDVLALQTPGIPGTIKFS